MLLFGKAVSKTNGKDAMHATPKAGLTTLIGTAIAMSFGISMAAAAMIIAVGALLGS